MCCTTEGCSGASNSHPIVRLSAAKAIFEQGVSNGANYADISMTYVRAGTLLREYASGCGQGDRGTLEEHEVHKGRFRCQSAMNRDLIISRQ